ncbi:MAG: ATP-binding protein [Nitrospirota bacterium]
MFFKSLRTKIIFFTVTILIVGIGFGTWINIDLQIMELRKLTEDKLTILANTIERSLSIAMLEGRSQDVQRLVEMVGTHNKIHAIRILNSYGVILRSANAAEIGMRENLDFSAMQIEDQSNIVIQEENDSGDSILRNLRPILNRPECFRCHTAGQKINGVLEVDVSLAEMQKHVGRLRKTMIIWAVAITGLLALALSTLLSKIVTTPIRDLTNTMAKAEEGLDVRAKVISEDELGRLAHSFNSMIIKLNKTKKKVEKLHYEQMKKADRLATVGEMAAGIAHEIKNPLTGIAGVIQILGKGIPPEDERHKIIKEVLEQIDRLDKAVKNLLSFARPPAPNLTEVSVNGLLEKIMAFLSPQFSKNRVTVRKDYSPDVPEVLGDPELLQQVFLNIILNGVQAMPGGGELRVKTSISSITAPIMHKVGSAEDMELLPEEGARTDAITITISDSGKGIQPENMAKIFNPFFTTRQQGTGLGLAITQKIIEQHGGGITVDSVPGEWTAFTIYLPMAKNSIPTVTV